MAFHAELLKKNSKHLFSFVYRVKRQTFTLFSKEAFRVSNSRHKKLERRKRKILDRLERDPGPLRTTRCSPPATFITKHRWDRGAPPVGPESGADQSDRPAASSFEGPSALSRVRPRSQHCLQSPVQRLLFRTHQIEAKR